MMSPLRLCARRIVVITVAVWIGLSLPASGAAPSPQVIQESVGTHLRIISSGDPQAMAHMVPEEPVAWDVAVFADAPEPGTIEISLSAAGNLALAVEILRCPQPWETATCPPEPVVIDQKFEMDLAGRHTPVLSAPTSDPIFLRFMVSVPPSEPPPLGSTTTLRVHATGYGDSLIVEPPGEGWRLPDSGLSFQGATFLAMTAVGLGVAGARLIALRRRQVGSA